MEVNDAVEQTLAGLGAQLKQARELQNLSQYDIAVELKLLDLHVAEMESGEYVQIKNLVFAKGYVRKYAQRLDMDVNQVMDSFDAASALIARDKPAKGRRRQPRWPVGTGVAIVVVIVLLLTGIGWLIYQQFGDDDDLAVSVVSVAAAEAAPQLEQPVDTEPPVDVVAEDSTLDQAGQETAGSEELLLRFSGDCWVEVRDARGKMLLADLKKKGNEVRLKGLMPMELVIGYAPAIEVIYDGRKVPVITETGQQSAKLLVGE